MHMCIPFFYLVIINQIDVIWFFRHVVILHHLSNDLNFDFNVISAMIPLFTHFIDIKIGCIFPLFH